MWDAEAHTGRESILDNMASRKEAGDWSKARLKDWELSRNLEKWGAEFVVGASKYEDCDPLVKGQ